MIRRIVLVVRWFWKKFELRIFDIDNFIFGSIREKFFGFCIVFIFIIGYFIYV